MARPKKQQPYTVIQPFQDAREYMTTPTPNQYAVGEDVSHFPEERLAKLVSLGLVSGGANEAETSENEVD